MVGGCAAVHAAEQLDAAGDSAASSDRGAVVGGDAGLPDPAREISAHDDQTIAMGPAGLLPILRLRSPGVAGAVPGMRRVVAAGFKPALNAQHRDVFIRPASP